MKKFIKTIFLVIIFILSAASCDKNDETFYGGTNVDGSITYGLCIICKERVYVYDESLLTFPENCEFLGNSSESGNKTIDGVLVSDACEISQDKFPDKMYTTSLPGNSTYYISNDLQVIYRERDGHYDAYRLKNEQDTQ